MTTTEALYAAIREALRGSMPLSLLLDAVVRDCPVDRDHIVAAMWDLVEDGVLDYDASGRVSAR